MSLGNSPPLHAPSLKIRALCNYTVIYIISILYFYIYIGNVEDSKSKKIIIFFVQL